MEKVKEEGEKEKKRGSDITKFSILFEYFHDFQLLLCYIIFNSFAPVNRV